MSTKRYTLVSSPEEAAQVIRDRVSVLKGKVAVFLLDDRMVYIMRATSLDNPGADVPDLHQLLGVYDRTHVALAYDAVLEDVRVRWRELEHAPTGGV